MKNRTLQEIRGGLKKLIPLKYRYKPSYLSWWAWFRMEKTKLKLAKIDYKRRKYGGFK
jgi:hypothetical protein